jgi:hypothetical protein
LFEGELDKVGRGAMGVRECRDPNEREHDNYKRTLDGATWALRLSYGVFRV